MDDWLIYRGAGAPHPTGSGRLPPPPPWRDFAGSRPDPAPPIDGSRPAGSARVWRPCTAPAPKSSN